MKEDEDEAQRVYGGADHSDLAGARGRIDDSERMQKTRREQCDVLQIEVDLCCLDVSQARKLKVLEGEDGRVRTVRS